MIKILRPLRAIRAKCLSCCCDSYDEVKICHLTNCALWPYRFGRRPGEEEKNAEEYDES